VLARKGLMGQIVALGMKPGFEPLAPSSSISDKQDPKADTPRHSDDPSIARRTDFHAYTRLFTNSALSDIQELDLAQEEVADFIQAEFLSDPSYFEYDILDYPLPIQKEYIAVLDKVGNNLTVRAVKRVTWTELELESWSSVLGLYRRATRHKYRTNPDYILTPEVVRRIRSDHFDIMERILLHSVQYNDVGFDKPGKQEDIGSCISNTDTHLPHVLDMLRSERRDRLHDRLSELVRRFGSRFPDGYKHVVFIITSAILALQFIPDLVSDMDNRMITEKKGNSEIVVAFERSLQHLHKIVQLRM
jgi:hypothetical protein